jgi:succinyl-CoA synthetase beta subunit
MKIHEFQAKEILRRYGIPTPRGIVCGTENEALAAAQRLGGQTWVIKAQIHAGGRGNVGGIKTAMSMQDVARSAAQLLHARLKTSQTAPEGQPVRRVLVEERIVIQREFYVGLAIDRRRQRVCLMTSGDGGIEIEERALRAPSRIHKVFIDPVQGLRDNEVDEAARAAGFSADALPQARAVLQGLWRIFDTLDATLIETNPLGITAEGALIALDAKMSFDANALFRHPTLLTLRDLDEEDPAEIEASQYGLSYIQLDGDIGCLVNGAGLAMATMDIIKVYGGRPANFLDVGGGASTEKVTEAFKIMLRNPLLKAILVNIFGGIVKCDLIATALVEASRTAGLAVPLIVRLAGTNAEAGKRILADSGLPVMDADGMATAAQKAVHAAAQKT